MGVEMKSRVKRKLEIVITILLFFATCFASSGLTAIREPRKSNWDIQPVLASTVRLHVVAESNEADSQTFKMRTVAQVQHLLTKEKPRWIGRDYQQYLQENLDWLEEQLQQYANTMTASPPDIKLSLLREEFPLRAYGRIIYPPGEYTALKVIIGEGHGDNWWCLLFPPLCLPFARASEPIEEQMLQNQRGEIPESNSNCIEDAAPSEETGGWKFLIKERWNRWFRTN